MPTFTDDASNLLSMCFSEAAATHADSIQVKEDCTWARFTVNNAELQKQGEHAKHHPQAPTRSGSPIRRQASCGFFPANCEYFVTTPRTSPRVPFHSSTTSAAHLMTSKTFSSSRSLHLPRIAPPAFNCLALVVNCIACPACVDVYDTCCGSFCCWSCG